MPSLKPNDVLPGWELVALLAPDHLHAGEVSLRLACLVDHLLEPLAVRGERRDGDVHLRASERLLPVLRAALAVVAEVRRARRHPLAELRREAVERGLRHPEGLQAVIREGDGDPGIVCGIRGGPSGVDDPVQAANQLASVGPVVDAQQEVRPDVRRRALMERPGLDVVQLEADAVPPGRDRHGRPMLSDAPASAAGRGSARRDTERPMRRAATRGRRHRGSRARCQRSRAA